MADGGWEHVGGAYIIQHLIEGAGWKEAGKEEDALENLKGEGIKKRGSRRLFEMGNAEWKRRENKIEGKKDETRKGSGREEGMDG